jgi:2-polyprenyl-3-methyl-5-hydroxy-6-metoxy-1,4-benzoquinol methylase
MTILPDVSRRTRRPELMDDPALVPDLHKDALRGLARLNRASGAARILWPTIQREAAAAGSRSLRVLDIATGSGDVPAWLLKRARRRGIDIRISGCDISPAAVKRATERLERSGFSGHGAVSGSFFVLDALEGELPSGYDIIMCSLFMHHLDDDQVVSLLYRMRCAAASMVLVSDLERRRDSLLLAWCASRLLTRSPVVHTDAMLSVRGAFTADEFAALAEKAGLAGAVLQRRWPCRFQLEWRRP